MNTKLFTDKGNVKMIAHRGVSGLERENTCPAFVAAGVKSYYGIETDVHVKKCNRERYYFKGIEAFVLSPQICSQ